MSPPYATPKAGGARQDTESHARASTTKHVSIQVDDRPDSATGFPSAISLQSTNRTYRLPPLDPCNRIRRIGMNKTASSRVSGHPTALVTTHHDDIEIANSRGICLDAQSAPTPLGQQVPPPRHISHASITVTDHYSILQQIAKSCNINAP